MATKKKLLQAAAGQAGGAALNVEDVFSTYLYEGNASGQGATAQSITNNIDLSGEGGLVWIKNRDSGGTNAWSHYLFDTERGATKYIRTNVNNGEATSNNSLSAFNSDGFTLGETGGTNNNGDSYASWTFRKAPKFFDVVTYTGDGTAGRTISHNLGCDVGVIIVKAVSGTYSGAAWTIYHKDLTATDILEFDTGATKSRLYSWNDTEPTDSVFTVGSGSETNGASTTYVAYIFAHNDGDGEFGPDGDADIIKCGSYTSNASTDGPEVDLGFEPQFVIIKMASDVADWVVFDNMRGVATGGNDAVLYPNKTDAEGTGNNFLEFTSTGFKLTSTGDEVNTASGSTYIYIAIRRGPMAVPESATDVFDVNLTTSNQFVTTGFPVDLQLGQYTGGGGTYAVTRMLGMSTSTTGNLKYLRPYGANTISSNSGSIGFNGFVQDGFSHTLGNFEQGLWSWRRAPNFFDTVAYNGNGTAGRTVSHNLGVAPEMMWVKRLDLTGDWRVYHSGLDATAPQDKRINLNEDLGVSDSTLFWNDTAPTDSNFTLGSHATVNASGGEYIAYLFASLDGISKLGTVSFTNGSTSSVDCGFSSGARYVLLKSVNVTGGWWVFDTERGIVSGNDPYLQLNTTTAENSSFDIIDPLSSGFQLSGNALPSDTYIFYAVA